MELARRHPEWLHAYIGTGQMIDTQRSEAEGYEFALQQARIDKNSKALRELKALAPYPGPIGTLTVNRIGVQRTWVIYYGGLTYRRRSFDYDSDAWKFSPQYTDRDLRLTDKGSLFSLNHLLGVVERTNFESVLELRCPIFHFSGKARLRDVVVGRESVVRPPPRTAQGIRDVRRVGAREHARAAGRVP